MTDRDLLLTMSIDIAEIKAKMQNLVTEPAMLKAIANCVEKHRCFNVGLSSGLHKKLIQALALLITAAASALTTWAATH